MRTTSFATARETRTKYVTGCGALLNGDVATILKGRPYALIGDNTAALLHHGRVAYLSKGSGDCLGTLLLPGTEEVKSIEYLNKITLFLQERELPKHGAVVALGGGAICDVASFATMLFKRGVELVLLPTTLLAQVDAAIGGKNGINFNSAKNYIGHFHHPSLVCCDQEFLSTLESRQIICGIAEIIKVFAVANASAFRRYLKDARLPTMITAPADWSELIWDAVTCKLQLLDEDPFEVCPKRLLNYGHLLGHFLEEDSRYALQHGEGVLIGMLIENEISRGLGIGSDQQIDDLNSLIAGYLTPACVEYWRPFEDVQRALLKLCEVRRGNMNLVCVSSPGTAKIVGDTDMTTLKAAWERGERYVLGSPCS